MDRSGNTPPRDTDRRLLLVSLGAAVTPSVTGCLDSIDNDSTATGDTTAPLSVDPQTVQYLVAISEARKRGVEANEITPEDEIPEPLRGVLSEARDDGFETNSVSESLLAAIDQFRTRYSGSLKPYVRLDGVDYEFDPSVPTTVVALTDKESSEYDTERLLGDTERGRIESDAVTEFVRTLTARGANSARSSYRRSVLPDAVGAFLDEYGYIEDLHGIGRIETTYRNAEPPHTITLRELTNEDRWGEPVVTDTELDDELVAFFEQARASEHRWYTTTPDGPVVDYTDSVPAAYFDLVDETESVPHIQLGETVYRIAVRQPAYDRIPVTISVDEHDAGAREFTILISPAPEPTETEIEGTITVSADGVLPSILRITTDSDRYLLDSPSYSTVDWASPTDAEADRRPTNEVQDTVTSDDEIAATYTVPEGLSSGTYHSWGEFGVSWNVPYRGHPVNRVYPFKLQITIAEDE
jgi:hypothetical protein